MNLCEIITEYTEEVERLKIIQCADSVRLHELIAHVKEYWPQYVVENKLEVPRLEELDKLLESYHYTSHDDEFFETVYQIELLYPDRFKLRKDQDGPSLNALLGELSFRRKQHDGKSSLIEWLEPIKYKIRTLYPNYVEPEIELADIRIREAIRLIKASGYEVFKRV